MKAGKGEKWADTPVAPGVYFRGVTPASRQGIQWHLLLCSPRVELVGRNISEKPQRACPQNPRLHPRGNDHELQAPWKFWRGGSTFIQHSPPEAMGSSE